MPHNIFRHAAHSLQTFCDAAIGARRKKVKRKKIAEIELKNEPEKVRTECRRAKAAALPVRNLKKNDCDFHGATAFHAACESNVLMQCAKVNEQIKSEKRIREMRRVLEQAI